MDVTSTHDTRGREPGHVYGCLLAQSVSPLRGNTSNARQALEAERDDRNKEVDDYRQRLAALQAESAEQAASMDARLQAAQGQVDSIAHRAEELQASTCSLLFRSSSMPRLICTLRQGLAGLGCPQLQHARKQRSAQTKKV